jgi:hypothetical protein
MDIGKGREMGCIEEEIIEKRILCRHILLII